MSAPITSRIVWRGIAVEITYRKRRWKSDFDHIELLAEDRRVLPVTETGYRSHFLPAGIVEERGGPESYVLAWLNHEAGNADWKNREEAERQMSLF